MSFNNTACTPSYSIQFSTSGSGVSQGNFSNSFGPLSGTANTNGRSYLFPTSVVGPDIFHQTANLGRGVTAERSIWSLRERSSS